MSEEIHASFWDHLEELRWVFIRALLAILVGLCISFYFSSDLIQFILSQVPNAKVFLFSPVEGFIAVFRLSFWLGALGTSPYWIFAVIRFLKPALRENERSWLPLFFLLSGLFIGLGFLLCVNVTLPLATQYLFDFNQTIGVNLWGFSSFLDFALMLLFSHGVAFEIGAVLFFLIHVRVLDGDMLAKKRRHAMVTSLVIGALLTPPDVLTQVCVALPLILFYELAILYGKLRQKATLPEHG
jgi:sec-independent protein translocase protein TatC